MGQIVSSAAKPKRCNLNQLSQVPTPAAGEHILVSSDNSMNAAGQGNFDCYIVGDGTKAATALPLQRINAALEEEVSQLGQKAVEKSPGLNLYNPDDLEPGSLLSNGTIYNATNHYHTNYIKVKPNTAYCISNGTESLNTKARYYCFYKEDYSACSTIGVVGTNGSSATFTTPADCVYVRLSIVIPRASTMFNEGNSRPGTYSAYTPVGGYLKELDDYAGESLFFAGTSIFLNKTIREVFLLGLDSQSDYRIRINYSNSVLDVGVVPSNSTTILSSYSGSVTNGIIKLAPPSTQNNGIHGWININVDTSSTYPAFTGVINKDICSDLTFSPSIQGEIGQNYWRNGETGKYLNLSGGVATNANFQYSDYIPIKRDTIKLHNVCGGNATVYCSLCFYDENKKVIGIYNNLDGLHSNFTLSTSDIPNGCAYIRVNASSATTPFVQFVNNETATIAFVNELAERIPVKVSSLNANGTVASGHYLTTPAIHIFPNSTLSAHISGSFTDILVGVGYNGNNYEHYAFYVRVTANEAQVFQYENSTTEPRETFQHGLTLGANTYITVTQDNSRSYQRTAKLIITTEDGQSFSSVILVWFGAGNGFVKNNGSSSINADIRLFPRSLAKNIWVFGDSYFSMWNTNRWPYYMYEHNFKNILWNHLSGQTPSGGLVDLQNLLTTGHIPAIIVWCLGMNGNADTYVDGQYVIDPTKKEIIDWLISYCNEQRIQLILATIPTVPTLQHEGLNNYIRSLGVRYIDFAQAVGAQADGTWTEGLCADGVHPTVDGAKVLFARAITDFPEFTID